MRTSGQSLEAPAITNTSTNPTLDDLAAAIRSIDIGADASRLTVRLACLVAQGRPVSHEQVVGLIDELDINQAQVTEHITAYAERDEHGDIIDATPGVTLRPPPPPLRHRHCAVVDVVCSRHSDRADGAGPRGAGDHRTPRSKEIVRYTVSPHGVSDVEPAGAVVSFPGLVRATTQPIPAASCGEWNDELIYAILVDEWRERQ